MIYSFGHGTASQDEILRILRSQNVDQFVDVRSFPGSRRNPHVNREALAKWLPDAGIAYYHLRDLGGFRPKNVESEKDVVWRNASFRNYAGYTRSKEFKVGILQLLEIAKGSSNNTVYVCSEGLWWRCHRRIITDYLVAVMNIEVKHLMHDSKLHEIHLTEGLRVSSLDEITYDVVPQNQCQCCLDI